MARKRNDHGSTSPRSSASPRPRAAQSALDGPARQAQAVVRIDSRLARLDLSARRGEALVHPRASARRRQLPLRRSRSATWTLAVDLAFEELAECISAPQGPPAGAVPALPVGSLWRQEVGSQYAGEIDPWARELTEAPAAANAADLDERITAALQGWTADRLGAVERSALRIAITEMDRGEVPAEVAIDEAVTFAKRDCDRRGGQARQRHPRRHPATEGGEHGMSCGRGPAKAEQLLAKARGGARASSRRPTAEQAIEILQELSDLAKQVDAEIAAGAPPAEAGCRRGLKRCAISSRRISATWRSTPELGRSSEPIRHGLGGKRVRPVLCARRGRGRRCRPGAAAPGRRRRRAGALLLARPRRPAGARQRHRAPR